MQKIIEGCLEERTMAGEIELSFAELSDNPTGDTALSEDQKGFLEAVNGGNYNKVREYILQKSVDVNCVNLLGETALQIAVNNDYHDIAKLLLNQEADVGKALLHAVGIESTFWVEALLETKAQSNGASKTTSQRTSPDQVDGSEHMSLISPLILAAKKDNQEMVKILLEKDYTIDEPHKRPCKCDKCEGPGRLGGSIHRLHCYQALASPVYLCLSYLRDTPGSEDQDIKSSKDPIIRALLLNRKLEKLVKVEYELKNEYQKLISNCEEFAVSLLKKCRTVEDISCLMSVPGIEKLKHVEVRGGAEAKKLSVLNFAISNKNEKVRIAGLAVSIQIWLIGRAGRNKLANIHPS